jgi:hypothetical protein
MDSMSVSGMVLRVEEKWTCLQERLREGILVSLIDENESMDIGQHAWQSVVWFKVLRKTGFVFKAY